MIELVGQLLEYMRLDYAMSPLEAIWRRNAGERRKKFKQEEDHDA